MNNETLSLFQKVVIPVTRAPVGYRNHACPGVLTGSGTAIYGTHRQPRPSRPGPWGRSGVAGGQSPNTAHTRHPLVVGTPNAVHTLQSCWILYCVNFSWRGRAIIHCHFVDKGLRRGVSVMVARSNEKKTFI